MVPPMEPTSPPINLEFLSLLSFPSSTALADVGTVMTVVIVVSGCVMTEVNEDNEREVVFGFSVVIGLVEVEEDDDEDEDDEDEVDDEDGIEDEVVSVSVEISLVKDGLADEEDANSEEVSEEKEDEISVDRIEELEDSDSLEDEAEEDSDRDKGSELDDNDEDETSVEDS